MYESADLPSNKPGKVFPPESSPKSQTNGLAMNTNNQISSEAPSTDSPTSAITAPQKPISPQSTDAGAIIAQIKKYLLLTTYLAASAYLLEALIGTVYFEPATNALASAAQAWSQALLAMVALFAITIVVWASSRKLASVYIAMPAALALVSYQISTNTLFPEIAVLVVGIPSAIALFQLSGKEKKLSKRLNYTLLVLLAGGVILTGYQLFYQYRTGIFNPYTQVCIQHGAKGAVGDACVN